jgi:hypothetical protein
LDDEKATVWDPCPTVKDCWTPGAGMYTGSPACEATIVHVPRPTMVTVEPDTVHAVGVGEVNDTASPEDADAVTLNGDAP